MFEFSSPPVKVTTDMKQSADSLLVFFTTLVELPFEARYTFENKWEAHITRDVEDDGFRVKINRPDGAMAVLHKSLSPELVVHIMEIAASGT